MANQATSSNPTTSSRCCTCSWYTENKPKIKAFAQTVLVSLIASIALSALALAIFAGHATFGTFVAVVLLNTVVMVALNAIRVSCYRQQP